MCCAGMAGKASKRRENWPILAEFQLFLQQPAIWLRLWKILERHFEGFATFFKLKGCKSRPSRSNTKTFRAWHKKRARAQYIYIYIYICVLVDFWPKVPATWLLSKKFRPIGWHNV